MMRRLRKGLQWLAIIVVVVLLVGSGGGYLWLRGSLPQTAGAIKVQGLAAPIEIIRDADAVPHVRAANEADALFGLGYVHAQDRLWQMEFQRRIGNAQLSEVLGEATVKTDKFLRTLGVARAARSAWSQTDPATRRLAEAYVAGINAFISTHHGRALPIEFTILGFEPGPWRPEDVLVWAKMLAWDLGGNWDREILRTKFAAKLGADKAAQLMPAYVADGPLILPQGVAGVTRAMVNATPSATPAYDPHLDDLLAINQTLQNALGLGGVAIGSNNWVIGGGRTTTGKPLLANDPHLGSRIPSIWYLAHITGGKLDATGATLPGLPGVVIGHNARIAWGVTNTGPDVQDLYQEHVDAQNIVEYNGKREPLQIIPEEIKVKNQPSVMLNVRVSRHGPLISDATEGTGEPLAFRWTALDPTDTTLQAFLGINFAQNWNDFTTALRVYQAPMQNFVYADTDGNIGYYAPGALPIRKQGDGTQPAPGWTDAYEWQGYVPFEQLPHAFNPPQGYVATANNKVVGDDYPYLISTNFAAPYRAARIVEMIEAQPKLSPDDIAAMQADVRSAQVPVLLPYLGQAKATTEQGRIALKLLDGWDGALRGDSAQAAIFEAWYQHIGNRIFHDELGDDAWDDYLGQNDFIAMQLPALFKGSGGAWCDDTTTGETEDCATTLGRALTDGLVEMSKLQGTADVAKWRWDRVHIAVFPHNPLDSSPLKPLFSRSIPNGGDGFTVDVAPVRRTELFKQYHVPSYREIIDLSNLDASRFMHTVGQSGQVLSGDYSNLLARWQHVEYLPMRFAPNTIDGAARDRLRLEP